MWGKLSKFMNTDFGLVARNIQQINSIKNVSGTASSLK